MAIKIDAICTDLSVAYETIDKVAELGVERKSTEFLGGQAIRLAISVP